MRTTAYTCWNTELNCRSTNYGTRIDYIFIDLNLFKTGALNHCDIKPEILGSDHCPVLAELGFNLISSPKCPLYCTKNFPEFLGTQQKLSKFFRNETNCDTYKNVSKLDNFENNQGKEIALKKNSGSSNSDHQQNENKSSKSKPMKPNQRNIRSYFIKSNNDPSLSTSKIHTEMEENSICSQDTNKDKCLEEQINKAKMTQKIHQREKSSQEWKALMGGRVKKNSVIPKCSGHKEPCVLRKVKKAGKNQGKSFFACARGVGRAGDLQAQCGHFEWQ